MQYNGNEITFERGDTTCSNCGAHIRNIVLVNGTPIGSECAQKYLPKNIHLKRDFSQLLAQQEAEGQRQLRVDLIEFVTSRFEPNRSIEEIDRFTQLALRRNSQVYIYWLAYQALRNMD